MNVFSWRALAALGAVAGAAVVMAHDHGAGSVQIGHPWARPTVAGQKAGGGYLTLENRGRSADRLLSARSSAAERVELHSMQMDGDVMRMRQLEAIELEPGARVELKPGGMHLMLVGLKAPLAKGAKVPLTLRFEQAGEVRVELQVEQGAPAPHGATGHAPHQH